MNVGVSLVYAMLLSSVWPMSGTAVPDVIQDPFGPRMLNGEYDYHHGVDFAAELGDPVHSVADGVVVRIATEAQTAGTGLASFGNFVLVQHASLPDGTPVHTAYLHLLTIDVAVGDQLAEGDTLGTVNSSGYNIHTNHLHFNLYHGLYKTYISKSKIVSPWRILPNPGLDEVLLEFVDETTVRMGTRISELDLVRLEVRAVDGSLEVVDFETGEGLCGDNRECNGITVHPSDFRANDEWAYWDVEFTTIGELTGACLYDVEGLVEVVGDGC